MNILTILVKTYFLGSFPWLGLYSQIRRQDISQTVGHLMDASFRLCARVNDYKATTGKHKVESLIPQFKCQTQFSFLFFIFLIPSNAWQKQNF